jgi:predicted nucleic acid-binding Zn ribbon protein
MRKNAVTIKEAIEMMVREYKLSPKLNESKIRESWPTVMGAMIARHTSNIALRQGKLYLKIESPALKHELTYSKEKIKEIFNKELGENVIREVLIF